MKFKFAIELNIIILATNPYKNYDTYENLFRQKYE